MSAVEPWDEFSDAGVWSAEPLVDWAEVESEEAQEAREESENGSGA